MPGKKCKKWASFSISQLQKWVKKLYKVVLELQLYYKKFFKRVKIIDSSTLYHGAYKNTIQFLAVWNELLEYLIVKFWFQTFLILRFYETFYFKEIFQKSIYSFRMNLTSLYTVLKKEKKKRVGAACKVFSSHEFIWPKINKSN